MSENWIIPCNVKVFNVIEHFKDSKTVIWKNSFTMKKGDIAYIYIGNPISEIRYKCMVISDEVDKRTLSENVYAILAKKSNNYFSKKEKYVELEYICEFPAKTFPLNDLRKNGLGQVQIQARTDRRLQAYISSVEKRLEVENNGC